MVSKIKKIKVTTTGYNHSLSTQYYAFFLLKYTLEQPVSAMLLEGGGSGHPPPPPPPSSNMADSITTIVCIGVQIVLLLSSVSES